MLTLSLCHFLSCIHTHTQNDLLHRPKVKEGLCVSLTDNGHAMMVR